MRELVPLTNEVAALLIVSAMSGFGGDDVILADPPAPVPSKVDAAAAAAAAQAQAATEAAAVNALEAPGPGSAAEAKAPPANDPSREHHPARSLLAAV